jgi:hypothetical protein
MMFTIEFFRIRKEDNARAVLDRITHMRLIWKRKDQGQVALRHF